MTHEDARRMNEPAVETQSTAISAQLQLQQEHEQEQEQRQDRQTVSDLVTHVRLSHHVATRVLLCRVEVALVGVLDGHEDRSALAARRTFGKLRSELIAHMAGEERSVFPYIRAIDAADRRLGHPPVEAFGAASPLRLAVERAGAEDLLLGELLALQTTLCLDGSHHWETAVAALRELHVDLVDHVRFENEELFPRAADAERRVVSRAMAP